MIHRVFTEKKPPFAQEAGNLQVQLRELLGLENLSGLRLLRRYDVERISEDLFTSCLPAVFYDPPVEDYFKELPLDAAAIIAVEYLPGQFDQLADSCALCLQFVSGGERPLVATARVYLLYGNITASDIEAIKKYLINPVECREASLELPSTLAAPLPPPLSEPLVEGFIDLDESGLNKLLQEYGLAMDENDLLYCQEHFRAEGRCPTQSELRIIDTYWSDHCRHTTFNTELTSVIIEDEPTAAAYRRYLALRQELGDEKPVTLMDIATMGARYLYRQGKLVHWEQSEEVNACTVRIEAEVNGTKEPWLLFFKNETHNHPTEIEPSGGAATCLGGGVRDPLSGRGYPYQAMRISGAGDPTLPFSATLPGKLPQRQLTTSAAAGYSSYGNQLGVPSGLVQEIYHPGYVAKRLEAGAVLAAAPLAQIKREKPLPGDVVLLVGGPTGRDGCGGAIGSSKAQDASSLTTLGAEVQKGNAPEERKLLRLFRNPSASSLIKRCNDFGAGGVAVAIGELAEGLDINLDAVPVKYAGLSGTELAISESQERMAVVLAAQDVGFFTALAEAENLQATPVAKVTDSGRMRMCWQGRQTVNISRAFLDSNGTKKHQAIAVSAAQPLPNPAVDGSLADVWRKLLNDINVCSQRGLYERFDTTAGAGTVLLPLGGERQLSPIQAMAAKLPAQTGETTACTLMSYGFNPFISSANPYAGGYLAVVESVSKLIASGGDISRCWLSFQEFFPKLGKSPERWGLPLAALLGALSAQLDLGLAAIGGKDSMSGSFEQLDVPPTLISFAVAMTDSTHIISPEFKQAGSRVALLKPAYDQQCLPLASSLRANAKIVTQLINEGKILSAYTPVYGGLAAGLFKMCLGNGLGLRLADGYNKNNLFDDCYGAFVLELAPEAEDIGQLLGHTIPAYELHHNGEVISLGELEHIYESKLEKVFPTRLTQLEQDIPELSFKPASRCLPRRRITGPKALIPVFPGTNCEYDLAKAFTEAGADTQITVVRNLTNSSFIESIEYIAQQLAQTQILVLPGDYLGGSEPEGSGRFIVNFFRHPRLCEALQKFLNEQDGLILGSGSGFNALLKLGLLPGGQVSDPGPFSPTLTINEIGRHQSKMVRIRVTSTLSPWLSQTQVGDIYTVAVSHSEGRFVCGEKLFSQLASTRQIASQYIDVSGKPAVNVAYNPSGSYMAVEALCSPDGRVFGQMSHPERWNPGNMQNIPGHKNYPIFAGAVDYFK